MSTVKTLREGEGEFKRSGPPKMSNEMRVLFDAWSLARTLPTFPEEDRGLGFDGYCRKYGVIGPNKERSLERREVTFSDHWPD